MSALFRGHYIGYNIFQDHDVTSLQLTNEQIEIFQQEMLWMTPTFASILSLEQSPSKMVRDTFTATLLMLKYRQKEIQVRFFYILKDMTV